MSQKERKWRRIYLFIMLFVYILFVPISLFEWLLSSDRFPIAAAVVAIALPFMRKNHLNTIRKEESSSL
ncbi:hypothetical protein MKX67_02810 [Cytobacillus sp. FSL W7-1323]|uniref:hypothetical protein n=1 Tax=Cytobacillus TaxID=2675230 RepID=UPI00204041A4|nr:MULTISPECIES: hypothetical protein [Cytobacillus]MCM3324867.1 hypothetical protein [Cytobacillus kochii]MCM3347260.1 hypothetical protein [Cytobacillus kochii]MDM5205974.1 hypothetical protein [Cytobacillus kochii]MEA1855521.1 hypothetical protein [Cytobacillus sp. OWB-43]